MVQAEKGRTGSKRLKMTVQKFFRVFSKKQKLNGQHHVKGNVGNFEYIRSFHSFAAPWKR
jgi:hypothetical protein